MPQSSLVSATQLLSQDLERSGLKTTDMDAYLAGEPELAAVGMKPHLYLNQPGITTPGYVIPYYDMRGNRAPFYRVRLFSPLPKGARYLQPSGSGSWLYFPKLFGTLLASLAAGKSRTKINGFPGAIILTEGEKKAARGCSLGFPTCAVGGVYNWRTRTVILPENTSLLKNPDNQIIAKMPSGGSLPPTSDRRAFLAGGLEGLMKFIVDNGLQVIIAFDTDNPPNQDVQSAAAELAFEFRIHGIPTDRIRQLVFPLTGKKMGLDDFLQVHGPESLDGLLKQTVEAKGNFPSHPNLRAMINNSLSGTLGRSEAKELTLMLLTDMDRHGQRMTEKSSSTPYFFDSRSKALMRVSLLQHHSEPLHETKFGEFLYKNYDVGQADMKVIQWLAAGFTGEDPVFPVDPRSVLALAPQNRLAYQVDDGHFVMVSGDPKNPISLLENGSQGLLFRSDQVEPVDRTQLMQEFRRAVGQLEKRPKYEDMLWPRALSTMKFTRPTDDKLLAILYYMSPWLLRWEGTQLPIELLCGEAGSGKSSLCSLRLQVLTGRPALRNQPTDVRDWYASITSQDGLHAIDNVHMVNKELRQRLSDEICRIVTEPSPYIEMRKLFTTSENFRIPVRTVFAMTAIQQPFLNTDILQRALIVELQAIGKDFNSDWASSALKIGGGRVGWLAQQLAVIHMFFRRAKTEWNPSYKSTHRLAHFEQMFKLIGDIIGVPQGDSILNSLASVADSQMSDYDWIMEGLREFNYDNISAFQRDPKRVFTLQDVASWAEATESYMENQVLTNARRLSRYIKTHKYMVEKVCGFTEAGRYGNRDSYRLVPIK